MCDVKEQISARIDKTYLMDKPSVRGTVHMGLHRTSPSDEAEIPDNKIKQDTEIRFYYRKRDKQLIKQLSFY